MPYPIKRRIKDSPVFRLVKQVVNDAPFVICDNNSATVTSGIISVASNIYLSVARPNQSGQADSIIISLSGARTLFCAKVRDSGLPDSLATDKICIFLPDHANRAPGLSTDLYSDANEGNILELSFVLLREGSLVGRTWELAMCGEMVM